MEINLYIRENYGKIPITQIAEDAGLTINTVRTRLKLIGIWSNEVSNRFRHRKVIILTEKQDLYIKENYGKIPLMHISNNLRVSRPIIYKRLPELGITVNEQPHSLKSRT